MIGSLLHPPGQNARIHISLIKKTIKITIKKKQSFCLRVKLHNPRFSILLILLSKKLKAKYDDTKINSVKTSVNFLLDDMYVYTYIIQTKLKYIADITAAMLIREK